MIDVSHCALADKISEVMRTISIETQLVDTVVNKLKGLEQDKFMKLDGICLFIVTGNSKCIKQVTDA